MVLSYYGRDVTNEDINQFSVKDEEGNSYETEIARFAREQGFAVDCYAYNLYLTDPTDNDLSQETVLEKLKAKQRHLDDAWYAPMLQSTIRRLERGGTYHIAKPRLDLMRSYLSHGIPLLPTINTAALYNKQGNPYSRHSIILTGFRDDQFAFIDLAPT